MDNSIKIKELESEIKELANKYYQGESVATDEYFDELVEELKRLDPNNEVLSSTGWGFSSTKNKVSHRYNMHVGSLSKVKHVEDLPLNFRNDLRISAKLDGLSVVSYYENGTRVSSVTRGDGYKGKDVTDKIDVISPDLKEIPGFTGALRGEVLYKTSTWDRIKSLKYKDDPSANARNHAAGVLNRDTLSEDLMNLSYVIYKVVADPDQFLGSDKVFTTVAVEEMMFPYMKDSFVPFIHLGCEKVSKELLEFLYDTYSKQYPCDGLVLTKEVISRTDSGEVVYDELAYKFASESKEVTVTDITWNPTRTGRLAPRIWFNPVPLSGAMVQKCTGFNAGFIRDKKINKGSVIEICRSGEVIPHILKVVNASEESLLPTHCPNCGSELIWSGEDLVCENENGSQLAYRFISVVGETEGVGYKLYQSIVDFFNLTCENDISNLIGDVRRSCDLKDSAVKSLVEKGWSGEVTRHKIMTVLKRLIESKSINFLVGCNIKGISWNSAKSLIDTYPDFLKDCKNHAVDWVKVTGVPGFGYKTVTSLQIFENRIKTLLEFVEIKDPEVIETPKTQFSIAITGSLSTTRSEFLKLAESFGITSSSNFNEIKYLVTNNPESTSSKMKKAKEKGVEIISEKEFFEKFLK